MVSDYAAKTVFQTENLCFYLFVVLGLVNEIPPVTLRFQIFEILNLKIGSIRVNVLYQVILIFVYFYRVTTTCQI